MTSVSSWFFGQPRERKWTLALGVGHGRREVSLRSPAPWTDAPRSASSASSRSPSAASTRRALRRLWIDTLGLERVGEFRSERENVDEDIAVAGIGPAAGRGRPHAADRPGEEPEGARAGAEPRRALGRRPRRGRRLARRRAACASRRAASARAPPATTSASSTRRATPSAPIGGEGVLIELVQAPPEVIEASALSPGATRRRACHPRRMRSALLLARLAVLLAGCDRPARTPSRSRPSARSPPRTRRGRLRRARERKRRASQPALEDLVARGDHRFVRGADRGAAREPDRPPRRAPLQRQGGGPRAPLGPALRRRLVRLGELVPGHEPRAAARVRGVQGPAPRAGRPRARGLLRERAPRRVRSEEILWSGAPVERSDPAPAPGHEPAASAALDAGEPVVGVALGGEARAYPLRWLDWHEVANDRLGGRAIAVAWCGFCASATAFDAEDAAGRGPRSFAASGLVQRGVRLMYDRETRTLWNELTGLPALGGRRDGGRASRAAAGAAHHLGRLARAQPGDDGARPRRRRARGAPGEPLRALPRQRRDRLPGRPREAGARREGRRSTGSRRARSPPPGPSTRCSPRAS